MWKQVKVSLAGYLQELVCSAVSALSEENQTEPLGECRVRSETILQIIGAAVSVLKSDDQRGAFKCVHK